MSKRLKISFTTFLRDIFFFFSTGPEAYATDAPQPVGLLCYPCTILVFIRCSHFRRPSVSSSVQPERPIAAKGGTVWARNIAGNFCLNVDFHVTF